MHFGQTDEDTDKSTAEDRYDNMIFDQQLLEFLVRTTLNIRHHRRSLQHLLPLPQRLIAAFVVEAPILPVL